MATKKQAGKQFRKAAAGTAAPQARSPASSAMPESDPQKKPFLPEILDRTAIAIPLLKELKAEDEATKKGKQSARKNYDVIIDLHLEYPGGREGARERVTKLIAEIVSEKGKSWGIDSGNHGINQVKSGLTPQYLFARLEGRVIQELIRRDRPTGGGGRKRSASQPKPAIYRIWPDFPVKALLTKSISTVKADAALNSFSTTGDGIVWAVMDSGIDATHPHFAKHDNLNLAGMGPLAHRDFTALDGDNTGALVDKYCHGTHVAGIIAGAMTAKDGEIVAESRYRDENGEIKKQSFRPELISGMAPKCKLLSLKVLDEAGQGQASNLIAAIAVIQEINGNGRYIRVHGVNMSVGYDFEPEWFACGQSPLCVEVDRLVKSGVAVVVAAGNSGYGWATALKGAVSAGLGLTINDPGNAELAVTVGSTHREMPHVYGVSYFSSKGPTGDGRLKPDLVAPGEKIISCASGWRKEDPSAADHAEAVAANAERMTALKGKLAQWEGGNQGPAAEGGIKPVARYQEDSGTSMAAPHVSGVIAAFLSVRREYIGRPERAKEVFLSTATDLRRDRYFQGQGLVDLMRAIQSV
jgi:subtilisin family serine protease